jgi:hypothetical protein
MFAACAAGCAWFAVAGHQEAEAAIRGLNDNACYNKACDQFNWAGVTAYDSNNDLPLQAGLTCTPTAGGQAKYLCAQTTTAYCAYDTTVFQTCPGKYQQGQFDCYFKTNYCGP